MFSRIPILIAFSPFIILVPVILAQYKSGNNRGIMLAYGLVATVIYVAIFLGLGYLAKEHVWIDNICTFPY